MNKKFVIASCIITSILILSINTAFASGFGGGMRGGSFKSSGFGPNTAGTNISYEALCELCVDINSTIASGDFTGSPINGATNYAATVIQDPATGEYYIVLYVNSVAYIYCNQSGGKVYSKDYYGVMLVEINTVLNSIKTGIDNLNTKISTLDTSVQGINSMCATMTSYLSNISARSTDILSRLQYISGQIADIDEINYKAVGYMTYSSGTLIPQRKIDYNSAQDICSWFNTWHQTDAIEVFNRDDTTTQSNPIVNLTATLQDVTISGTTYHIIRIVGYTSAGNVYNYYLCDQTKNIITYDLVPNGSGGGSNDYSAYLTAIDNTLSNLFDLTADIEVAVQDHDYTDFLNPIVDGTRRNIGEAAFYSEAILEEFRHNMRYSWNNQFAQIPNIANRLIVTVDNVDHTAAESLYYGYQRLISIDNKLTNITIPNYSSVLTQINGRLARDVEGVTYTVADSTYHTMVACRGILTKQDDIIDAINSIQDWLDNADLATNATITSMIQEEQAYLNDISPSGKRVKNLFKRAYDFTDDNYNILDWAKVMVYFSNPWSDSPWEVG